MIEIEFLRLISPFIILFGSGFWLGVIIGRGRL